MHSSRPSARAVNNCDMCGKDFEGAPHVAFVVVCPVCYESVLARLQRTTEKMVKKGEDVDPIGTLLADIKEQNQLSARKA